jgi:hypothetical protein
MIDRAPRRYFYMTGRNIFYEMYVSIAKLWTTCVCQIFIFMVNEMRRTAFHADLSYKK